MEEIIIDPAVVNNYGLIGAILVAVLGATAKGIHWVLTNNQKNVEKDRELFKETLEDIQDRSEKREDKIVEALKEQGEAIKNLNFSLNDTNSKINIIEKMIEGLKIKVSA